MMRNKNSFKQELMIKCPFDNCGKTFFKTVTIDYVTNQRGDVIQQGIK